MPSPFPGMNPYLEQETVWHDFHQSFMPAAREMLTRQVAPAYVVKVEEHVFVHELLANQRSFLGRADAAVVDSGASVEGFAATSGSALLRAPAYAWVGTPVDVERQSYLEIRDREGMSLVAVVELLIP